MKKLFLALFICGLLVARCDNGNDIKQSVSTVPPPPHLGIWNEQTTLISGNTDKFIFTSNTDYSEYSYQYINSTDGANYSGKMLWGIGTYTLYNYGGNEVVISYTFEQYVKLHLYFISTDT
jgi:hypothetical protein